MKTNDERWHDATIFEEYIEFLKTRRGDGKNCTKQIVKILLDARNADEWDEGWVRARKIKDQITYGESTLFRQLEDLEKYKIIVKDKPGNKLSSYRLSEKYPNFHFLTNEEISEIHQKKIVTMDDMEVALQAAHAVLARHNLLGEYQTEKENFWKVPED
jgi:Fe2+ or Zn2+ uptake regulation protein